MKLKIEIGNDGEDEVIIRCRERTDQVRAIESAIEGAMKNQREILLHRSDAEHYIPIERIMFFESNDRKIYAYTANDVYTAEYKLFELEDLLPVSFVRISKSSIVNVMQIASLRRELVGNGELTFKKCDRKAYFSRGYYHVLRDKIDEIRLNIKQ